MSVTEARANYEFVLLEKGIESDEVMKASNAYAEAIVRRLQEYDENGEKIIYVVKILIDGKVEIETHTDSSSREALIREGFTDEELDDACERIKREYPNWEELVYIKRDCQ
jgi:hypothetical protein